MTDEAADAERELLLAPADIRRAADVLVAVGLIALGVRLRRAVFIVFGVLGVHVYLGHLAYEVFKDSVLFPFALALLGLSVILFTVSAQRYMRRSLAAQA